MRDIEQTQSDIMRTLEEIPTQTYIGLSLASMVLSAFFFLIGRRSTALFIGQWVPSLGIFALMYKLLRPSGERPLTGMRETVGEVGSAAGEMTSRARH